MEVIRAGYDDMFELCTQTAAGFIHDVDPRDTFEVSEDERYEFWERLLRQPGIWYLARQFQGHTNLTPKPTRLYLIS